MESGKSTALVVQKQPSNALQQVTAATVQPLRKKPKKEVISEETYVEGIEKIIQRDFYPDLPKLRTQLEWLEAEQNHDLGKMREIHLRVRNGILNTPGTSLRTPNAIQTPASFTPLGPSKSTVEASPFSTPARQPIDQTMIPDANINKETDNLTLNQYLAKYTSEDNASFEQIMEKQNEIRKHKYAYLLNKEKESQLLITDGNNNPGNGASLLTWQYTAKNALMYNKDGVGYTEKEEKELNAGPQKEILLDNTRFKVPTSTSKEKKKQKISEDGKVNLDEVRGLIPKDSSSPKVRGYGFVATPSPAPGVDASPFTTWGTIEGTPLLLDLDIDTSKLSGPIDGPQFKLPETSRREQLAMELTDKMLNKNKRKEPSTPKRSMASPSPLHVDHQLKASYSPRLKPGQSPLNKLASPRVNILRTPKKT